MNVYCENILKVGSLHEPSQPDDFHSPNFKLIVWELSWHDQINLISQKQPRRLNKKWLGLKKKKESTWHIFCLILRQKYIKAPLVNLRWAKSWLGSWARSQYLVNYHFLSHFLYLSPIVPSIILRLDCIWV